MGVNKLFISKPFKKKIIIPFLWKNRKKKLSKKLEHLLTKILKTKALNIIFIYNGIKKVLSPHKKKKKEKKRREV